MMDFKVSRLASNVEETNNTIENSNKKEGSPVKKALVMVNKNSISQKPSALLVKSEGENP